VKFLVRVAAVPGGVAHHLHRRIGGGSRPGAGK